MKKFVAKTTALLALLLVYCCSAGAQTGPTANVTSVYFTYTANSSTPPVTKNPNPFTVTLPASMSTQTMQAVAASNPPGWLSVTPASGRSPLLLTVTVNPTTLDPGNHSGTITIDTTVPSGNPAVVLVTIAIGSASPTLKVVTSPPSVGALALAYTYVTGDPDPAPLEVDVASSSDVIPFTVTAANAASKGSSGATKTPVWLRVNQSGLPPNLTTSGVALSGSVTQIFVSIDHTVLSTLDPISSPFSGLITITPNSTSTKGSPIAPVTVAVTLQVSPGPPSPLTIFPTSIPAAPPINPVITIYGNNFFKTSAVTIQKPGNLPIAITDKNFVCIDRTVIQVTIQSSFLTDKGVTWTLTVQNANQPAVTATFDVTDPALPIITSVVNSASYLATAIQATGANPVPVAGISVSPREIISIYGRNLGPDTATPVPPASSFYPWTFGSVTVVFLSTTGGVVTPWPAPLIMISSTQINCVVPSEVDGSADSVTAQVTYNGPSTPAFSVTVVPHDPGIFTFDKVGQGQAAILNFDSSTGSFTVNSSKTGAAKNSAISIYVTGVGDLDPTAALADGAVAPANPISLAASPTMIHVDIDGQPSVVTYAGTSPGAVAGLVQINAIVPLSAKSGSVPITVSIGTAASSRRSQPGVTVA
ncbi:MAG: hypothetical protein LAQ69_11985, partial [Acidobacteriia bacterium]|nr:hypothetical protein [Terriglobia bacterium]